MPTILRPVGNLNTVWSLYTYDYSVINANIPTDTNGDPLYTPIQVTGSNAEIQAVKGINAGEQGYNFGNFPSNVSLEQITVWVFGRQTTVSYKPITMQIGIGDISGIVTWNNPISTQPGISFTSPISLTTDSDGTAGGGTWKSYTFNGPFNVTTSQSLVLGLTQPSNFNDGNNVASFSGVYAVISNIGYIATDGVQVGGIAYIGLYYTPISQLNVSGSAFIDFYKYVASGDVVLDGTALASYLIIGTGLIEVGGSALYSITANILNYVASGAVYVDDEYYHVGIWNFDEGTGIVLNDKSLNGNNGQLSNMTNANWSTSVSSLIKGDKYSLNFTNNNPSSVLPQYIYFDNTSSNRFNFGTGDFSVNFWLRCPFPTPQNSNQVMLISKDGPSGWNIGLKVTTSPTYRLYYSFSWNNSILSGTVISPFNISNGSWYNINVMKNSTQISFYINGVSAGAVSHITASSNNTISINNTNQLRFANLSNSDNISTYNFLGYLDEIRIYSRVLTNSEITSLANGSPSVTAIAQINTVFIPYLSSGGVDLSGQSYFGIGIIPIVQNIDVSGSYQKIGIGITSSGGVSLTGQGLLDIKGSGGVDLSGQCRPGIGIRASGGVILTGEAFAQGTNICVATGGAICAGVSVIRTNLLFTLGARETISKTSTTLTNAGGGDTWIALGITGVISYAGTGTHTTNLLKASNFGFNLPSNTTIYGLVATIGNYLGIVGGTGSANAIRSSLVIGGVVQTYNHANSESVTTYTNIADAKLNNLSYGNENDGWSASLSPSIINSSNFGFTIQYNVDVASTNSLILASNLTISLSYIAPIDISGSANQSNGLKFTSSGGVDINGNFISNISDFKYISIVEDILISGDSIPIVLIDGNLQYIGNGLIETSGSAIVSFYNYIGGQGASITVGGNMSGGWTRILSVGTGTFIWFDDFNRPNNIDLG